MHRIPCLIALALASSLIAPPAAEACCGEGTSIEPLAWSHRGELLARRFDHDGACGGRATLEVLRPSRTRPVARYDLGRGGRRLAAHERPRAISEARLFEMWENAERDGTADPLAPPAALGAAFPITATAACGPWIHAQAAPTGRRPRGGHDAPTRVTVDVAVEGEPPLATGARLLPRWRAESSQVELFPSPDRGAILARIRSEQDDDVFLWLDVASATEAAAALRVERCEFEPVVILPAAVAWPRTDRNSAQEILASLAQYSPLDREPRNRSDAIDRMFTLASALWSDPSDRSIRTRFWNAARYLRPPASATVAVAVAPIEPPLPPPPIVSSTISEVADETGDAGEDADPDARSTSATDHAACSAHASRPEDHAVVSLLALVVLGAIAYRSRRFRRRG